MSDDQFMETYLQPPPDRTLDDVVGLEDIRTELRTTLFSSVQQDVPDSFRATDVLLYGPRGAGKRTLAKSVAGELATDGFSYHYRTTLPDSPDELFAKALENTPVVVVLDCFDDYFGPPIQRTYQERLAEARDRGLDLFVIAVIEEDMLFDVRRIVDAVDVAIELDRPDIDRRQGILAREFDRIEAATDDEIIGDHDLVRLARETDRFGVRDLEKVAQRTVQTVKATETPSEPLTNDELGQIIDRVGEERMEEIYDEATLLTDIDTSNVTFGDIGGYEEAKAKLVEQVENTFSRRAVSDDVGVDFGSGVLLHGPPGTGKTMLVRALANELDYAFIPISTPAIARRPTKFLPQLFHRAQRNAPAILFFDEFDSIGTNRNRPDADEEAVNTLLTELDGIEPLTGVLVIAATNLPETLDPALLRPGRFDYHIEVEKPTAQTQAAIFEIHTREIPLADDVTAEWFAEMTETVTGAEIAAICARSVAVLLREQDVDDLAATDQVVGRRHIETAYEEFDAGRLYRADLGSSPAFY